MENNNIEKDTNMKRKKIIDRINQKYGLNLDLSVFQEHPTLRSLMNYLMKNYRIEVEKTFHQEISELSGVKKDSNKITEKINNSLREKVIDYLKRIIASTLKLSLHQIEADAPLEKYGINSIIVVRLTDELEKDFGSLSKTLFFEYQNISNLADYFLNTYGEKIPQILGVNQHDSVETKKIPAQPVVPSTPGSIKTSKQSRFKNILFKNKEEQQDNDIAIVGLVGKYPGADDIDEFWENLKNGKDCITEIPLDRFDWRKHFDADKHKMGTIYSKWGGFINGVDEFDPLFFNISPREAEFIEPQERLFLECVYKTLEDAGYTREILGKKEGNILGQDVGVFAGVMYEEYQLYGAQEQQKGRMLAVSSSPASIANRISYFFNFKGPSVTLDTMCSSSLTAIHFACRSIQNGECEAAIAGGVNVSIHINKYLYLSQGKFASTDGRCKSFGKDGDGYVPGEGVGAVLLKPLAKAIADCDHIYGVIKGTAVNAGGKTNGYTVPNPNAQSEVISRAIKNSGINGRDISYIETHGTGTSLGDPIEIAGLTKAFNNFTLDKEFCAIGSVKSNVGHLESAAGIAALTKVLLQMKYRQLVPSLHSKELNPNINFKDTPFVVQQELTEWKSENPRIAGISSFGAGGANAHIIIEEYRNDTNDEDVSIGPNNPAIIVLSARNEERLKEKAKDLLDYIDKKNIIDKQLPALAYTLQTGRESMEYRLAFTISSVEECKDKLSGYLDKNKSDIYYGQQKQEKEALNKIADDTEMGEAIKKWVQRKKYNKLLELWVDGLAYDWKKMHDHTVMQKMSLPTYPFDREKCWIETETKFEGNGLSLRKLHPLVHENTSDFYKQKYSSVFEGVEFFFTDHKVNGKKILPGVAYLEMVRSAIILAMGNDNRISVRLKNIIWVKPVIADNTIIKINIGLHMDIRGEIGYEIYSESGEEIIVHSQGNAELIEEPVNRKIEIRKLQDKKWQYNITKDECYGTFKKIGIEYGEGFRGIDALYFGEGESLAKIMLPEAIKENAAEYFLHPSIMDSAFQAIIGLLAENGSDDGRAAVPFAIDELEILNSVHESMWAVTQYEQGNKNKINILLCDDDGNVCVQVKGLSIRVMEQERPSELLLLKPEWKEEPVPKKLKSTSGKRIIFLCEAGKGIAAGIESRIPGASCINLEYGENTKRIDARYEVYCKKLISEIRKIIQSSPPKGVVIQGVVFGDREELLFSGLSGIIKTAVQENPGITGHFIQVEKEENIEALAAKLEDNAENNDSRNVMYKKGKRLVENLLELPLDDKKTEDNPWKEKGVYLITGGLGGVGRIIIKDIAGAINESVIIITGRSDLDEEKESFINGLRNTGTVIEYRKADIIIKQEVDELIDGIKKTYGKLDIVIHSAGVLRDSFILKKTRKEAEIVLKTKITGLINLDEATKNIKLDHFILFSSIAGVFGSIGQADYSAANAFMDLYAYYRNIEVAENKKSGKTLSMSWPLWKEGGMEIDEEKVKLVTLQSGMVPMESKNGIKALRQSMASDISRVLVFDGIISRLKRVFLKTETSSINEVEIQTEPIKETETSKTARIQPTVEDEPATANDKEKMRDKTVVYFKKLFSSTLKMPAHKIEIDAPLEKYGIDSVMVMQLTNDLEKVFGSLSKTLFFEYKDIQSLVEYFIKTYPIKLAKLLDLNQNLKEPDINELTDAGKKIEEKNERYSSLRLRFHNQGMESFEARKKSEIAIIGIAGRYPGAQNVDGFWENLKAGKDCITEIPSDRWDWKKHFDPDKNKLGKTYTKWGGFISGVDEFDPLFFSILPKEAKYMDPQERIFLECVYKTLEDAGYTRENISIEENISGGNVGVFVGVMYEEYQLYGAQAQAYDKNIAIGGTASSIANRVSYTFNFRGPSVALDTMCSSSLTALHLACQSIENEDCETAIVGGVNLSIHPNKYLLLAQGKFASSKGRCESFGIGGDGYVPGEGVGAILLKPLEKAVEDGDHIYGIIKGTALNAGGKTNGFTVPNPSAQAAVIQKAIERAGINARSISYVEAHGTGTSLGDPIEISALTKAFNQYTQDKGYCAIGSVKSNIGHLESAAGIASITKVLLQLKHKKIVPSLHSKKLNPNIDFKETPFVVQQELSEWKSETPRIAGISSFGAGGTNTHVIIEEYINNKKDEKPPVQPGTQVIIVLSAKNKDKLKEKAQMLLNIIKQKGYTDDVLPDIAYTLQVGREGLDERVGFITESLSDFEKKLGGYIDDNPEYKSELFCGQLKQNKITISLFKEDEDLQRAVDNWFNKKKYEKLLDIWAKGLNLDWSKLYKGKKYHRISLPGYPFAKDKYWIDKELIYINQIHDRQPEEETKNIQKKEKMKPKNDEKIDILKNEIKTGGNPFEL